MFQALSLSTILLNQDQTHKKFWNCCAMKAHMLQLCPCPSAVAQMCDGQNEEIKEAKETFSQLHRYGSAMSEVSTLQQSLQNALSKVQEGWGVLAAATKEIQVSAETMCWCCCCVPPLHVCADHCLYMSHWHVVVMRCYITTPHSN